MPTPGPKAWSHLEQDSECQLAYQFRYLDKVKFKKPEAMRFGIGFHEFRFRYYEHLRGCQRDTDWAAAKPIAESVFGDKELPLERLDEFMALCRQFAENRPFSPTMHVEMKFGVNRDMTWSDFDNADFFRGVVDGLEIRGDVGVITDAKTARSTALPFTQLKIYAAFLSIRYPKVKDWRLVFDFVRMNRQIEERVLAANLAEVRQYVRARVEKIETRKKFQAQPSESCLLCPFLSRCDYRIRGLKKIEDEADAKAAMQDYYFMKAKTSQTKRLVKGYVENFGMVETATIQADFFTSEKLECDKRLLIRILKTLKQDPVAFIEFSPKVLKKLLYNKDLGDEVSNAIFVEHSTRFNIKKRGKQEDDPEETPNADE